MTEQELEYRLKQAVLHTAPDDVEAVLSRCSAQKGDVLPMTKKPKKKAYRGWIAACLALALVGGGAGAVYQQSSAVASVVSYIVTEGKLDAERVKTAVENIQQAADALTETE